MVMARLRIVRVGALLAAGLLAGCAATPEVYSDYDRATDFSQFRTFNVIPDAGANSNLAGLASQYVRDAAVREMQAMGYTLSDDPDLIVNFTVSVEQVTEVSQVPSARPAYHGYRRGHYDPWPGQAYDTWVRNYEKGALVIDVADPRRGRLVWTGMTGGRVTEEKVKNLQATVEAATARVFDRFPARAGQAASVVPAS